ncbi:thioredoxin family protein [Enhygromyxa salina]|uniref:Thiol:disulfide interchange protein DsbD n=1 Tax=Enhygromyxa salina TaxID=215803 RepID=A0A2S9YW28_9BACT|nr:thioredoxin family protein [Enhygromyxa salina]PRQ09308.1 Thiol:disulfide interchange protein DsbD precursor [Enhygromyxa salina]
MSRPHRVFRPTRSLQLLAALALMSSLLGCGTEEHEPPRGPVFEFGPAPASPTAPTQHLLTNSIDGAAVTGIRDDGSIVSAVEWFDGGLEQALAAAKAQAKLVFVDVGAYWCPPCHELDEKTFTDPRVGEWLAKHAIAVHVDAEKGEGPDLVERYHVQAYPTLLMLEATGIEKGRLVDFIEPDALVPKLEELAAGGNVLAELEAAVEAAPADVEARYRLGHAYVLAARQSDAERVYAGVIADDIDNAKGLTSKVIYDLAMFFTMKLEDDPETAILQLQALQSKFPDSPEATKAYRMIGRAYCQLGKPDEAVAALEAMLATDPEDVELAASFGWFAFREKCRPDAGLAAVLAGIGRAPDNAELRYLEAELRELVGEPEAALVAIRKASELEPDSAYYKRQVRRFEALTGD